MTQTRKKTTLLLSWGVVMAVAVLIFFFSSQTAKESTQVSNGFIESIYRWYRGVFGLPCSTGDLLKASYSWNHFVRKLAHFSIYTVLGFFSANALYHTCYQLKKAVGLAILLGSLYAVSDEIHQIFVPGRSCQLSDMLLDSCGVVLGTLLFCSALATLSSFRLKLFVKKD